MKTSNLREGDWVEWWYPKKQCWISIEINLEDLQTYRDEYNSEASNIRPLILTPELLEFWGYTKEETNGLTEWISPDRRVILRNNPLWINSQNTWGIHIDSPDMDTICNAELSWVHQLQNILDFCNIPNNFKLG